MLLKICGITREEDARLAARCGADFVGAIHVEGSRRFVSLEQAARIFAAAAPARGVLVVRDMERGRLQAAIGAVRPYAVQLHGRETACYAMGLAGAKVWKAFDMNVLDDLSEAAGFPADMIVADSGGGTGRTCDWGRAAALARRRPILLAGGIAPDNVRAAVAAVHPAGIDVAGGVESAPGVKDHAKVQCLCGELKGIDFKA